VNSESPITRLRWCLKLFTVASYSPSKCCDIGGIKCHVILCELANLFMWSLCSSELNNAYTSFNWLFVPTKLVPLSELIFSDKPRLAINRDVVPQEIHQTTDHSRVSKCAALIVRHTNTYVGLDSCAVIKFFLFYIKWQKSTSVLVKGLALRTRTGGRFPILDSIVPA